MLDYQKIVSQIRLESIGVEKPSKNLRLMQKAADAILELTERNFGEWREVYPDGISLIMTGEEVIYACSVCDWKYPDKSIFCPHCGAQLER